MYAHYLTYHLQQRSRPPAPLAPNLKLRPPVSPANCNLIKPDAASTPRNLTLIRQNVTG
ncbi:hypothetical protein C8R48DRAFT_308247 [Suillus tomentosus]|nr:hypothetical protein C8R48DRAFT_308247 [Suillus tomentosus]